MPAHCLAPFDVLHKIFRLKCLLLSISERIFVYSLTHSRLVVKPHFAHRRALGKVRKTPLTYCKNVIKSM